jgi:hypothetical protein
MWIMLAMGSCWIYSRLGRATRGKWRIPDGKGESVMDHKFRAPVVVVPTYVDKGSCRLGHLQQALRCVLTHANIKPHGN